MLHRRVEIGKKDFRKKDSRKDFSNLLVKGLRLPFTTEAHPLFVSNEKYECRIVS
jgi:hypothetical protein